MLVAKHCKAHAGMAAAWVEQSGVTRPGTAMQVVIGLAGEVDTGVVGTTTGVVVG